VLFAVAIASVVWWKWEDIVERPGVRRLIKLLTQPPIQTVPAGQLTIAVAHLEDDRNRRQEKLLLDELRQFDGVEVQEVDRTIKWPTADSERHAKEKAEEEARRLLGRNRADVLIWGSVITVSGKSAMRLYWTPAQDVPSAKFTGKYQPQTETIALPPEFWNDLKHILGMLAQSRLAALTDEQFGHYVADKLVPLVAQVQVLVQSRKGIWNPETRAGVQFSLTAALALTGEQSGKNEPLAESIELYREVFRVCPGSCVAAA